MTFKAFFRCVLIVIVSAHLFACGGGDNGGGASTTINTAPIAIGADVDATENESIELTLLASDEDGDTLNYLIVKEPINGSVLIDNDLAIYTPNIGFFGLDSFDFKVNDGSSDSEIAAVNLNVKEVADEIIVRNLNDTGTAICIGPGTRQPVRFFVTNTGLVPCPIAEYPNQDAEYGRDFEYNDDSDGYSGFSFTKLDDNGSELLATASEWSCVKDNVTGLIWEGDHSKSGGVFSWYSTHTARNHGYAGSEKGATNCYGYDKWDNKTFCNTQAYINRINLSGLCGYHDWRLPSLETAGSIIEHNGVFLPRPNIYLPTNYFTGSAGYWTSTPSAMDSLDAWIVNVDFGVPFVRAKSSLVRIRLVRGQ